MRQNNKDCLLGIFLKFDLLLFIFTQLLIIAILIFLLLCFFAVFRLSNKRAMACSIELDLLV